MLFCKRHLSKEKLLTITNKALAHLSVSLLMAASLAKYVMGIELCQMLTLLIYLPE